ncbi:MAG: hypothetical protein DKM50_08205 [Candidatus Margulisiibacteriota bacterium]|nr:MAG: hypothetical protein DKM50_08205 [Candidatus Margulisiibacteriota bacterium]HAR62112.1 hypothetical protein [Candidatus Margulisiibacteriota bacterium]HCY38157.1 hypothetical protein [Candidatus Margulisiibacteriota bacterium]
MVAKFSSASTETISLLKPMNILKRDYQRTSIRKHSRIYDGLDAKFHNLYHLFKHGPHVRIELLSRARDVDGRAAEWSKLSDKHLKLKLEELRELFRREKADQKVVLPQAFAAIREVAGRELGLIPYPVQIAGAWALYRGYVSEMATGEGKTLVAGMAAVLNAWSGNPCHIITVNDYLAERDAALLSPLYKYCGLTCGCVTGEMDHNARKTGYNHDIVYTTSKEIVADFLRDRLWLGPRQLSGRRLISFLLGKRAEIEQGVVMRGIHTAIVDEADSILIDEAVTPLIISKSQVNQDFVRACEVANSIAASLIPGIDYKIDHRYKDIELSPGFESKLSGTGNGTSDFYNSLERRMELIKQAITAREFFHKDKQYIVQDGKIVIVDEFTGRMMPQRTWQSGLQQLIEAKENLEISGTSETLARLSFQRFFRFFHKLSGMTGTAKEAATEMSGIYHLPVVPIPVNKPCKRKVYPAEVYPDNASKWRAIVEEIRQLHVKGRPVLIGTRSVQASEQLAAMLQERGLVFRLLNAVKHKEEAMIVTHAGEPGMITVATNMAGRGTDIILAREVVELGGLHVIGTECHESKRIDRQLFGRAGRQGDPGSSRLFVSMEDELLVRYVPGFVRRLVTVLIKNNLPGGRLVALQIVNIAQNNAQRIAYKRRKSVVRMDTWLDDSLSFAYADVE